MKKLSIIFVFIILGFKSIAQSDFLSSGGNEYNSAGEMNYSIGQVFIEFSESSVVSQNQGVQQPAEWYKLNSEITSIYSNVKINIFPNPTVNYINLEIEKSNRLNYIIQDLNGKNILEGKLIYSNQIDVSRLSNAIYIINLYENLKWIQSSKFEKN